MNKPKITIGVDIGSSCIKVVELKETKSGITLKRAGLINTQLDPANPPTSKGQYLAATLAKLLAVLNIKNVSIITSVPGQSVLIRLIKLPPIPEDKIEEVIKYEAQQQVPFSLDEVVWDYYLLKRKKILEMEVLLVAIKINLIGEIQDKLGPHLNASIIDVAPLALYNCVRYNKDYENDKKGVVVIDIGAESTDIIFFKEEDVWIRSFPLGGNSFTQVLQKEFGLSYAEAERIKKGGLKDYPDEEVKRVTKPIIEDLIVEVQHAIGYYRSQVEGLTIGEVILTGGNSRLPNLDHFFSESLGLEVKHIDCFKRIKREPNTKIFVEDKWDEIEPYQHLFGVAAGLALRDKTKCAVEINLLSQELVKKKTSKRKKESIAVTLIIFFIILGSGFFMLRRSFSHWQAKLTETQRLYNKEYSVYRPEIETLKKEKSLLEGQVEVMYQLLGKKMMCLELCRAIGKNLTEEIWIDSLSFPRDSERAEEKDKEFLFLKGKAMSFDVINEFMQKLKADTAYISKIEPLASNSIKIDDKEFIEFFLEGKLALKVDSR